MPAGPIDQRSCASCLQVFTTRRNLETHGRDAGHSAFRCHCGGWFARYDSLQRHIAAKHLTSSGTTRPSFPCPVCHAHDGDKAFTRRDHLTQHLRTFHRFDAKGISHFRVRSGRSGVPASLPLNSGPLLLEAVTPEPAGGLGQTGVEFTADFGTDNMFNFASLPNNFSDF